MTRILPLAMAAPVVVCATALTAMLLAGRVGVGPLAPPRLLTLSEAAATGDLGTVRWHLRQGHDPNQLSAVANGVASIAPLVMPLEAGARSGDATMVRLLQDAGATLAPDDAWRVACLMLGRGRPEVAALIAGDRIGAAPCAALPSAQPDVP